MPAQRARPAAWPTARAALSFVFRFRRDLENRLRGGDHRAEALIRLLREPDAHGLAARLVHRVGHSLAQRLRTARVELDRRDRHALAGEAHRLRPGAAELDARVLEPDEVVEGRRNRAEA